MRLLLDEHFSPKIAQQLRARGHDVVAVQERSELAGRPDWLHFATAPDERRAIVTRDLGDFRPMLAAAASAGAKTYGLVCVSQRFDLSAGGLSRLIRTLEALLVEYPEDDSLPERGGEVWLKDE